MRRYLTLLSRITLIGGRNLGRNLWLTLAAVFVMVISLTISLAAIVANITANKVVSSLSENLRVSVYLEPGVSDRDSRQLQEALMANPAVTAIDFVGSGQTRDQLVANSRNNPEAAAALETAFELFADDDNMFNSLRVSLNDLNQVEAVGAIASQPRFDDLVESDSLAKTNYQATVERARDIGSGVGRLGYRLAGVLALVAFLIIFNTIRVSIFSRRQEIEIMRLVGARSLFVRGSLLFEAGACGLLAGVISGFLIYFGLDVASAWVANQAEFASSVDLFGQITTIVKLFLAAIGLGVVISLVSAWLATGRYLRKY